MTNNTRRLNIDHAACGHPLTKSARALCRSRRALVADVYAAAATELPALRVHADVPERDAHFTWLQGPAPVTRPTYEPCTCTGKPKGFHADDHEVWVCVTCEKPTALYLKELGLND